MMLDCFNRHGCDRGESHRYDKVYQDKVTGGRILEVGIFKGHGIAAWLDYFPDCHVTAIDIFERIQPADVPVLDDPRVSWYKGDSRTIKIEGTFDYIFDDGNHHAKAQMETFENLYPLLNEGGVYFIEDVFPLDRMSVNDKRRYAKWIDTDEDYQLLLDSLPYYRLHDLRGLADSFIIEICK